MENPDEKMMRILGFKPEDNHVFYQGKGCAHCHNTGFRGRLGIFEMMLMNSELRELAFKRAPTNKVREVAIASGMRTLLEDGKMKVMDGTTTLEEVAKHAQLEGTVVL